MLSHILHYLAVWRWDGTKQEPLTAVDSCIGAVEVHFPCAPTITNPDSLCLCEQYFWRATCFPNHNVDSSPSCGHRNITEEDRDNFCKAAGSVGFQQVKRDYERDNERRQVTSMLSSIAATVSSVRANATSLIVSSAASATAIAHTSAVVTPVPIVSSLAPAVSSAVLTPAAVSSLASAPRVSSAIASLTSRQSNSVPTAASSSAATTGTAQGSANSSTPTASPTPKPGPSAGLIAGAVIGSVAVLVLVGILVVLILRYRKKNQTDTPAAQGGEHGGGEKEVYHQTPEMYRNNEMATHANVWELEGHAPQRWELQGANAYGVKDPKPAYLPPCT